MQTGGITGTKNLSGEPDFYDQETVVAQKLLGSRLFLTKSKFFARLHQKL
jgi:hypothetical protein